MGCSFFVLVLCRFLGHFGLGDGFCPGNGVVSGMFLVCEGICPGFVAFSRTFWVGRGVLSWKWRENRDILE